MSHTTALYPSWPSLCLCGSISLPLPSYFTGRRFLAEDFLSCSVRSVASVCSVLNLFALAFTGRWSLVTFCSVRSVASVCSVLNLFTLAVAGRWPMFEQMFEHLFTAALFSVLASSRGKEGGYRDIKQNSESRTSAIPAVRTQYIASSCNAFTPCNTFEKCNALKRCNTFSKDVCPCRTDAIHCVLV
jgi:hypothetical protein